MQNNLNLLIVEDNSDDANLIEKLLERAGLKFRSKVISSKEELITTIAVETFDIILSDNSMFQFNSLDVLNILKENNINTPLIILSGTVSDDFALQIIKEGAFDYVNKDNIKQLAMSIKKAVTKSTNSTSL